MRFKKGGMATNIMIFTILFAFGLTVWCGVPAAGATCPYTFNINSAFSLAPSNIVDFLNNQVGVLGIAIAIIGTTVFPNPYIIFVGFSIALMGFVNTGGFLSSVIGASGMPTQISQLVTGILSFAFVVAVWSWWKGGDTP